MFTMRKQDAILMRWYNEQIKQAWNEKDGNRALHLEKQSRDIAQEMMKQYVKR